MTTTFRLLLIFIGFISACIPGKINKEHGIALTNQLLSDLKNQDYSRLDNYYINSFNASEPLDRKIEKFKKLYQAMGAIDTFELQKAEVKYESVSGINQLHIQYKLTCRKVVALQTFILVNDEGQPKIIFQNTENYK
jgi:hypothetical protein